MTSPPPSASTAASAPHTSFAFKATILVASLAISLGTVGAIFRVRVRRVAQIEKQLELQEERQNALAGVAPQHAEYRRLIEALETRINTIQFLKNSQSSPVELMNSVGKLSTQNADVDLTSLSGEGTRLVFRGRARSVRSAARFLASLPDRDFSDVQLREFYQEGGHNSTTYRFEFDCVYSPR